VKQRRHSERARAFGWRLLGVIVAVIIVAAALVAVTRWLLPG
jgi:hypothetical protein